MIITSKHLRVTRAGSAIFTAIYTAKRTRKAVLLHRSCSGWRLLRCCRLERLVLRLWYRGSWPILRLGRIGLLRLPGRIPGRL